MNNKAPNALTEEELIAQLNESDQTVVDVITNDILLFISTYNIQEGKELSATRVLYRLYRHWSKNPVSYSAFTTEMCLYFEVTSNCLHINQKALKLSKMAQEAFLKKSRAKSRSPRYRAHVELFMKQCDVSKGTLWLTNYILFDLYDEWCYTNNRSGQMNVKSFTTILKFYLKYKRIKDNSIVFAVNKSVTKHISDERIEIYATQGRSVMPKKPKKLIKPVKKINRRSKAKYPALDPTLNLRTRYEEIEQNQYINGVKNNDGEIVIRELTHSEKDWLNRFNEEFVNANFNHKGKKIDATKASKKRSYDKNNARNRCIYTKAKASGTLSYIEDLKLNNKEISSISEDIQDDEDNE